MDGLGHSNMQLFDLDIHGNQRQRYAKGSNGTYVSIIGPEGNMELVGQWAVNIKRKDI